MNGRLALVEKDVSLRKRVKSFPEKSK